MQNPFMINKSYTARHKILEVLYKDWQDNNEVEREVGSIKVAKKSSIPIGDIHLWQGALVEKGEITSSGNDGQIMMVIQLAGRNAYAQAKYIKEGRKETWDNIWDPARIIIPLGALILSIITLILNNKLNKRVDEIQIKIDTQTKHFEKIETKK